MATCLSVSAAEILAVNAERDHLFSIRDDVSFTGCVMADPLDRECCVCWTATSSCVTESHSSIS